MPPPENANAQRSRRRWWWRGVGAVAISYVLLLLPEPPPPAPRGAGQQAFRWNRDAFWSELEAKFRVARGLTPDERSERFAAALGEFRAALHHHAATNLPAHDPQWELIERRFFELSPLAAVCPEASAAYFDTATRLRLLVKWQSESWPLDSPVARARLYRLLYGTRAALEEVLLQIPQTTPPLEVFPTDDAAATPAAAVNGLQLHSGDILVSRGGAATSALIARGNDFPGNFSHVALVHVDENTKQVSVVESHIESGVAVRSLAAYLADTKLRIMVLRVRADLPAVQRDPLLPHRAAALAGNNARARHIPYDFAMDFRDPAKQFCSEVAAAAYGEVGVTLWQHRSQLSTPGVTGWLAALGVRHFETQEPSDLEYDPQVRVVAEWRDPEALFKDHVDNAVIDAMLEGAERGERLGYNLWMLPAARLAKAWSGLLNQFGKVGPVPEGMSATTALRVGRLKLNHSMLQVQVLQGAAQFKAKHGYPPPYWELVRLAREAHAARGVIGAGRGD